MSYQLFCALLTAILFALLPTGPFLLVSPCLAHALLKLNREFKCAQQGETALRACLASL